MLMYGVGQVNKILRSEGVRNKAQGHRTRRTLETFRSLHSEGVPQQIQGAAYSVHSWEEPTRSVFGLCTLRH